MIHIRKFAYQRVTDVEYLLNVLFMLGLLPVFTETAFVQRVCIMVANAVIESASS